MSSPDRTPARLPAQLLLQAIAAGLLLGALVGGLLGGTRAPSYHATTIVSVLPDEALTATQTGTAPTAQDATDFIQSELVVINSRALRSTVQRQLGLASLPRVAASQQGTTYVVDITATAGNRAAAARVADATRVAYGSRRSAQLAADVRTAQSAVAQQIATVRGEIAVTPGASTNGNSALQQEYARLLAVSSSLQLAGGQTGSAVMTIQPATSDDGGLSSTATWAAGGGVLGALAGAVVLLVVRRLRPVVRGLDDLDGMGATVVLPVFDREGPRAARSARLLASRLRNGDANAGEGSVTVVVSGAPAAPGGLVAALASSYAASARVLVVSARIVDDDRPEHLDVSRFGRSHITGSGLNAVAGQAASGGSPAVLLGSEEGLRRAIDNGLFESARQAGWIVVVDVPPLSESELGMRAASRAGSAVLVAAQGSSRRPDLCETVDVLAARGVLTIGVVLERSARRLPGSSRVPGIRAVRAWIGSRVRTPARAAGSEAPAGRVS